MSPVEILLIVACVLLLALVAVCAAGLRRLTSRWTRVEVTVDRLREQVEELARRESARETAEAARLSERSEHAERRAADYVITFDESEPTTVSTQRVVSTTLGEPLIKVAALSHGVRRALREEKRAHLAYQVRREYRRRRRATRARERTGR